MKIAIIGKDQLAQALFTYLKKWGHQIITPDLCEICWIAIDTPVNEKGQGNVKPIFEAIRIVKPLLKKGTLVIVSSQIPVGTSKEIIKILGKKFGYAYMPEHVRVGRGAEDLDNLKEIFIGTDDERCKKIFKGKKVKFVSVATAEMIKHALNAFLATSLSFIYDIADLCENVGADVTDIAHALRSDYRIGPEAYLDASVGFSGGHLERDLDYLRKVARRYGVLIPVINAVAGKNNRRFERMLEVLSQFKKVTFWGLSYKQGVDVDKSSLPMRLMSELKKIGIEAVENEHKDSQAIVCITPSEEMKKANFKEIARLMKKPKLFFDARNYFKDIDMSMFKYIGVGR